MTIPICQICKDPVWSYICPECLEEDIRKWLPSDISTEFAMFSKTFLKHFNPDDSDFQVCLHCRTEKPVTVCPFCYIAEVCRWLEEKGFKQGKTLLRMLPLGSDYVLTETGCQWSDGIKPVGEPNQVTDEGLCESCGQYSDDIRCVDGRWLCENCRNLEE